MPTEFYLIIMAAFLAGMIVNIAGIVRELRHEVDRCRTLAARMETRLAVWHDVEDERLEKLLNAGALGFAEVFKRRFPPEWIREAMEAGCWERSEIEGYCEGKARATNDEN